MVPARTCSKTLDRRRGEGVWPTDIKRDEARQHGRDQSSGDTPAFLERLREVLISKRKLARPKRFELLTPRFVVWCSIQLSYGR